MTKLQARAKTTPLSRAQDPQGRAWLEDDTERQGDQRLMLYGIVGDDWDGFVSDEVVQMLAGISQERLTVHLNTPGGYVWEGLAIANHLRAHRAEIDIVIDGLAASMGSFMAMTGDRVGMHRSSMMMIHNPWTVSAGDAEELRRDAEMLDKVRDTLVAAYMEKSGKDREDVIEIMRAETWYTAEEAVAEGFADFIVEDQSDAQSRIAALDLSLLNMDHAPQAIRRLAHKAQGRGKRPTSKTNGKSTGGKSMKMSAFMAAVIAALGEAFNQIATNETRDELKGQLAEINGMSTEDVDKVLAGEKADLSLDQLNNMAFLLDTDVASLLGEKSDKGPAGKGKGSGSGKGAAPDDPVATMVTAAKAQKLGINVSAAAFEEDPAAFIEGVVSAAMEKGADNREAKVLARAKDIKDKCRQANRPNAAMELFLEGLSPEETRDRLLAELSQQQRVDNSLTPGGALGGGGQPQIDTFAIYDKRRKAS